MVTDGLMVGRPGIRAGEIKVRVLVCQFCGLKPWVRHRWFESNFPRYKEGGNA